MLLVAGPSGFCEKDAPAFEGREGIWGMRAMKISGMKFAAAAVTGLLGLAMLAAPGRLMAQASIHGHVINALGQTFPDGEVKLTKDKKPTTESKYDYTFPIDPTSGNYKGTNVAPGNYVAVAFQKGLTQDFMQVQLAAGDDKTVDFDMTRKEYIDKMSPAERDQLETLKKQNAEAMAANAKIGNLNNLLSASRAAMKAGTYDVAVKDMMDATAAKPDEAILWDTLGDAQLGQANAAAKAAHDAKATDASLPDKYSAAVTSYQKAIALNAALAKPNAGLAAAANNQMGEAFGKTGKSKEAAAAYDAAAAADPTKAGMYYYNEAATLLNANDGPDAAIAADKAIAADPTRAEAYYIKAEGLAPSITTTPDGKYVAPPGLIDACNAYVKLMPDTAHAQELKDLLAGLGEKIQMNYKAPTAKRK
jgi:tetratricopeptide (TPR) repeat protein